MVRIVLATILVCLIVVAVAMVWRSDDTIHSNSTTGPTPGKTITVNP